MWSIFRGFRDFFSQMDKDLKRIAQWSEGNEFKKHCNSARPRIMPKAKLTKNQLMMLKRDIGLYGAPRNTLTRQKAW